MRIFVDANILVSVLNKEYPLYTFSSRLLKLIDTANISVYTSPVCLAIASYFAETKSGALAAKKKIGLLADKINITVHSRQDISLIVANNRIEDFEDGLEYNAAINAKCSCIITNDTEGFHFSKIPIYKPDYFILNRLWQTTHN